VPADGTVLEGEGPLDLSLLTGESRPRSVAANDDVFAGTVNRGRTLVLRVERAGEDTRLGRILREVEAGASRRAPVVRAADRLAGGFVAVVLVLAVVTWALWRAHDPSAAIDHAIALLIITCPCALALATPLAVTVAIGRAARAGVLVKGGDTLEALAEPGTLVLDKTGTLTEGRAALLRWAEWDVPNGCDLRALVLGLERHATHPVAAAFADRWAEVTPAEVEQARVEIGGGVEGVWRGQRIEVGSPAWITRRLRVGEAARAPALTGPDAATLSPVWVAVDGRLVARALFGDQLRADAAETLGRLRAAGWQLHLLSGDDPTVVAATGRALGFAPEHVRGGASPEDKRAAIEALAGRGRVVMVGDGVNDAAAIAHATVGVGVRGGAEACLAAADVYLSRPGLAALADLTAGSRRTLGVIRTGLVFSLAWNVVGAALAMAGWVNPLVAAIGMPVSSLSVVVLAWRSRTFDAAGA
ncbi:MAG: heavy metal translocating P-type ATPase, partial [Candidatus Eisenbacteria bacterium]